MYNNIHKTFFFTLIFLQQAYMISKQIGDSKLFEKKYLNKYFVVNEIVIENNN